MLPYKESGEGLLLGVMITRQTGVGLGFKLTPAYLLQMCLSYCVPKGHGGVYIYIYVYMHKRLAYA